MEIKLLQEFDFNDKNSLFGQMENMNDAIVKEIKESGNSLYITLHEFDDIESPSGEVIWPYKELEIEYAEINYLNIEVFGDRHCMVDSHELFNLLERNQVELEMNDWMITASGLLLLKLLPHPKEIRRKFRRNKMRISSVDMLLLPKIIIYRWKS